MVFFEFSLTNVHIILRKYMNMHIHSDIQLPYWPNITVTFQSSLFLKRAPFAKSNLHVKFRCATVASVRMAQTLVE